mmetsp:Transcript_5789/g.18993  ORF Transcript_5789/g.18993 Transcript_5789/m.18993 type:complete len:107 (+) Transcript_5789:631-951(+)
MPESMTPLATPGAYRAAVEGGYAAVAYPPKDYIYVSVSTETVVLEAKSGAGAHPHPPGGGAAWRWRVSPRVPAASLPHASQAVGQPSGGSARRVSAAPPFGAWCGC